MIEGICPQNLHGSCAVPWETSVAISTTTTNKPLILHSTTATEGESVQRRSHTMSTRSRTVVTAIELVCSTIHIDLVTYPTTTVAVEQSPERVPLYAFILRHQFPVTSFVSLACVAPVEAFHPVIQGDELIRKRGAVSELITGSPLPYRQRELIRRLLKSLSKTQAAFRKGSFREAVRLAENRRYSVMRYWWK